MWQGMQREGAQLGDYGLTLCPPTLGGYAPRRQAFGKGGGARRGGKGGGGARGGRSHGGGQDGGGTRGGYKRGGQDLHRGGEKKPPPTNESFAASVAAAPVAVSRPNSRKSEKGGRNRKGRVQHAWN